MQSLNSLDKLISLQYLTSIIPSSGNGIRNIGDSSGDSIGNCLVVRDLIVDVMTYY